MNKLYSGIITKAKGVDGIVKPISDMATNLRELQKAKNAEADALRKQIEEISARIDEAEAEAARAGSIAVQLEEVIL